MKKTYRNQLPKNMEVKDAKLSIENGEVVVDIEFKEKFVPNDGDFVVDDDGDVFIVWEKGNTSWTNGAYVCIDKIYNEILTEVWNYSSAVRLATEKEKSDFLNILENEFHKTWNAEKKCLENAKWKPKISEEYFYINEYADILSTRNSGEYFDKFRIKIGNCFKTSEDAKPYANMFVNILKK